MRSNISQVKNRAPAPIQITAEQLLREAKERGLEDVAKAPKQYITDKEELLQYQQAKRKDFEDQIRRQRQHIGTWCRYGLWEAAQKEYERARSVFERALDVDYRNQIIWFKYIEMEMKNKFPNHARNILDRAVALHPRVDKFWFKYSYMEEMIGAIEQARQVFERWMQWEPDDMGWSAYIKFEMRQGEITRSRGIYERYIGCHPTTRAYLKYAKWEERQNQRALARMIYERAMQELHQDEGSEKLLINFARFEERCKEFDRARVIYTYAIEHVAKEEDISELNQEFIAFEKRHGSRKGIEDAIVKKRRGQYEEAVAADRFDYDSWFDYCRLEEAEGDFEKIREVFERAISNAPPIAEKRFWRRYIYLWINYALFEEMQAKDLERTRAVYKACLKVIPHREFTFGKIWMMAAQFEVRQKDLAAARKILGQAIGMCSGKENLYKGYIALELQLGEVERCRTLYGKYLENMPFNCTAWRAFAQLEINLGETSRARAIYEIAVGQPELDMPEMLWKAFIDFEIGERESDNVRTLYQRLLERTSHVKVWISYGKFEGDDGLEAAKAPAGEGGDDSSPAETVTRGVLATRDIFQRGYDQLKRQGLKEERVLLLEAWRDTELALAEAAPDSGADPTAVELKLPRKVKMRRMATAEDGSELGWEEYYDYIFPDDEKKIGSLKILEKAMMWKQAMAGLNGGAGATGAGAGNEGADPSSSSLGKRRAEELGDSIDIDDI